LSIAGKIIWTVKERDRQGGVRQPFWIELRLDDGDIDENHLYIGGCGPSQGKKEEETPPPKKKKKKKAFPSLTLQKAVTGPRSQHL
jgi:hypothetical protein